MFRGLAEIFVNAFGITKPAPEHQERTGMIIAGAIAVIIALMVLAALTLYRILG